MLIGIPRVSRIPRPQRLTRVKVLKRPPRRIRTRIRPRRPRLRRGLSELEIRHLRRIPEKHGVEGDLFDFEAHLDRSLTYHEAKTEITRKVLRIAPMRVQEIAPASVMGDLETHLDNLVFKASAGDIRAKVELESWKKHRRM